MSSEKKKIAFFVHSFPVISETFILNQIVELIRSGHEVDIYAFHKPMDLIIHDAVHEYQLIDRVTYLDSLPLSRISKLKIFVSKMMRNMNQKNLSLFFYYINYLFTFKKRYVSFYNVIHFLDKPTYDIVHAHYGFSGKIVADFKSIGLLRHSLLVTTFHGYDFRVEDGFYKKLFQVGDIFTVNTLYSKYKLENLGCPENKISILPVGYNASLFNTSGIQKSDELSEFTLIFIGRLYAIKAPDFFIEICEVLKNHHQIPFRTLIIGDGDMNLHLQEMVNNKNLNDLISLLGSQKQDEIRGYLKQSDVFVLTGREVDGYAETQGLVVQEAQAMGIPVVVSDIGGIAEGILKDETGFAIEGLDAIAFADKIAWLYHHSEERKLMGQKAAAFAANHYTSEYLNKKLIDIYTQAD